MFLEQLLSFPHDLKIRVAPYKLHGNDISIQRICSI